MLHAVRTLLVVLTLLGTGLALMLAARRMHRHVGGRRPHSSSSSQRVPGALLALTCALLWSLSYVSLKQVSSTVLPATSSAIVTGSAAFWLWLVHVLVRAKVPVSPTPAAAPTAARFAALCAVNVGNFGLSIYALEFVSATHAMALANAFPAVLLGLLVVRRKLALNPLRLAAPMLVLLGVGWLWTARAQAANSSAPLIGSILALGAGVCFALWTDLGDDLERAAPSMSRRLGLLSAVFSVTAVVLAASLLLSTTRGAPTKADWLLLGANGLRVALVYVLFQGAVRLAGPLLTAVVVVLQVPLTLLTEAVWLGLPLVTELVLGVVAISAAAVLLLVDDATAPRVMVPGANL